MINFYLDSGFSLPITQIQTQVADGHTTSFTLDSSLFSVNVFSAGTGEIRLINPNDTPPWPTWNGTPQIYGQQYTVNTENNSVYFSTPPENGLIIAFFSSKDSSRLFNDVQFVANGTEEQRTQMQEVFYKENNQYTYSNVQISPITLVESPFTNINSMSPLINISIQTNSSFTNSVTNSPFLLGTVDQNTSGSFWIKVKVPTLTGIISNWRITGFQVSGIQVQND